MSNYVEIAMVGCFPHEGCWHIAEVLSWVPTDPPSPWVPQLRGVRPQEVQMEILVLCEGMDLDELMGSNTAAGRTPKDSSL